MNNKILIAAFACASVMAAAQSNTSNIQEQAKDKDKAATTTQTTPARDMATGQMSGKRAPAAPSSNVKAPRDLATGQASGRESSAASVSEIVVTKKSAQDDWQAPAKKDSGGVRVAPADVNGDGKADRVAKGDVNGDGKAAAAAPKTEKRQHSPATFEKEVGPASPSK